MNINDGLELLELRVFRATERPKEALNFALGQREQLLARKVKGVKSADNSWTISPFVFLMVLYAGDKVIGGTRLHLNNEHATYPFLAAVESCDKDLLRVMERPRHPNHAEGCGLWINERYAGYGLGDFLTRVLITTAHRLGLDHIYGICPRHTMDVFRKIGFHFHTLEDTVIAIPYPKDYTSFLIQCEVAELRYTFQSERLIIKNWISDQYQNVVCKGKLGELIVKLTGFPEAIELSPELQEELDSYTTLIETKALSNKKLKQPKT